MQAKICAEAQKYSVLAIVCKCHRLETTVQSFLHLSKLYDQLIPGEHV